MTNFDVDFQAIRNVVAQYALRGRRNLLPAPALYKLRGAMVGMIDSIFGKDNRRARLAFLSDVFGHPVHSSDDLVIAECRAILGWMLADDCGYQVDGKACGWQVQEPAREVMEDWLAGHQYLCHFDPARVEQMVLFR